MKWLLGFVLFRVIYELVSDLIESWKRGHQIRRRFKVKYRKEKPHEVPVDVQNRLFHLELIQCEFISAFGKMSDESQEAFEKELDDRFPTMVFTFDYNPCTFSKNTENRKFFVDDKHFKLLLMFSMCSADEQKKLFDRIEELRNADIKSVLAKAKES
jgi:hypothetical protein